MILLFQPPYNFFRQAGQVIAGNVWGLAFRLAVPLETLYGIDLQWLLALTPVAIALGANNLNTSLENIIKNWFTSKVFTLPEM